MQQVMGSCSPARVNSKQLLSTCMSCVPVPRSLVDSNAACLHEYVCVCARVCIYACVYMCTLAYLI